MGEIRITDSPTWLLIVSFTWAGMDTIIGQIHVKSLYGWIGFE